MLSSFPLAIWMKSYSSNLCPKYASETVFSGSKCKMFPAQGGGHPHTSTWLFRSLAVLLSEIWKYTSFQEALGRFARSLIMMMNISETACLMWVFWRHTVVYIIVPYHAQILPPLGRFAPSQITFGYTNMGPFQKSSLAKIIMMMNVSEKACLMLVFWRHTVVYIIVPYHAQILPPLGRFAPSQITFGYTNMGPFQRSSLAKIIMMMNVSEKACLMLVFWRHTVV